MKLAVFSRNSNRFGGGIDGSNGVMKRLDIWGHSHKSGVVVAVIGSELPDVVEEIALTDIKLLSPKYPVPGDIVRLEIDGIGVLENPVDSQ
jgi:2-keto-4-pentenoate hydratase/2-oxohepta-3-ene-1,7-dioic acid hydratase in catechol pathway